MRAPEIAGDGMTGVIWWVWAKKSKSLMLPVLVRTGARGLVEGTNYVERRLMCLDFKLKS